MITMVLTDDSATLTLQLPEVPLSEVPIENATDVVTLSGDVFTDFISQKRRWEHTWAYMSNYNYVALRAFYDRQFTLFKYPLLTIDYYSIESVPVRMTINTKDIIDNCGTLQNVSVTFRETSQIGGA